MPVNRSQFETAVNRLPIGRDPAAVRQRIEAMEILLERAFTLPGTNYRIGLDVILDLIPVVGDVIAAMPRISASFRLISSSPVSSIGCRLGRFEKVELRKLSALRASNSRGNAFAESACLDSVGGTNAATGSSPCALRRSL